MKFRLIYDGPLLARQGDPRGGQTERRAEHIHSIRRVFHGQLKRLWDTNRFLKEGLASPYDMDGQSEVYDRFARVAGSPDDRRPLRERVAELYQEFGYSFIPLVREDWELYCDLDILFLRRDPPGSIVQAGDIDNRIKTLIDALRRPRNASELYGNESPAPDEDPFFVLMEDDNLITRLSVETDMLLDPNEPDSADQKRVHLIISVNIRPYTATRFNLVFS